MWRRLTMALIASPSSLTSWRFDSVLEGQRGCRFQSLQLYSTVSDELSDAQRWCAVGGGVRVPNVLHVQASSLSWTVHLVIPGGSEPLTRETRQALTGYYDAYPPVPDMFALESVELGSGTDGESLQFRATPPHYFLGVTFTPTGDVWALESVDVRGEGRSAGPRVSSASGERIDFTAVCPSSANTRRLEVQAVGGTWTVYLISVAEQ